MRRGPCWCARTGATGPAAACVTRRLGAGRTLPETTNPIHISTTTSTPVSSWLFLLLTYLRASVLGRCHCEKRCVILLNSICCGSEELVWHRVVRAVIDRLLSCSESYPPSAIRRVTRTKRISFRVNHEPRVFPPLSSPLPPLLGKSSPSGPQVLVTRGKQCTPECAVFCDLFIPAAPKGRHP